jgi:hypothetical protein
VRLAGINVPKLYGATTNGGHEQLGVSSEPDFGDAASGAYGLPHGLTSPSIPKPCRMVSRPGRHPLSVWTESDGDDDGVVL